MSGRRRRRFASGFSGYRPTTGIEIQMIALFVIGLLLHGLNFILPAFVRDNGRLNVAANLLNAVALRLRAELFVERAAGLPRTEYRFALPVAGPVVIRFRRALAVLPVHVSTPLARGEPLRDWLPAPLHRARPFRARAPLVFHAADRVASARWSSPTTRSSCSSCGNSWPSALTSRSSSTRTKRKSGAAAFGISSRHTPACFALRLFPHAA